MVTTAQREHVVFSYEWIYYSIHKNQPALARVPMVDPRKKLKY